VKEGAKQFELNLLAGSSELRGTDGLVALHVSARFDEGKIVINSLDNGTCGKEKRVKNPFHPNEPVS
jgi:hypothetical protein